MAYNYFPQTYQQPVYYPTQTNAFPTQQSVGANQPNAQSALNWVQGEAGAKSYLVAPNSTVVLWDTESQTVYVKSADPTGMPSIKTLDYTVRGAVAEAQPAVDYATKDDVSALKEELESLKKSLKEKK